jgi:hypothetical protein
MSDWVDDEAPVIGLLKDCHNLLDGNSWQGTDVDGSTVIIRGKMPKRLVQLTERLLAPKDGSMGGFNFWGCAFGEARSEKVSNERRTCRGCVEGMNND